MNNKKQELFTIDWLSDKEFLNDPNKEWNDFGEFKFNSEKKIGYKTLIVHFETKEDFNSFINITKLPISIKTKWTWYPFKKRNKRENVYE